MSTETVARMIRSQMRTRQVPASSMSYVIAEAAGNTQMISNAFVHVAKDCRAFSDHADLARFQALLGAWWENSMLEVTKAYELCLRLQELQTCASAQHWYGNDNWQVYQWLIASDSFGHRVAALPAAVGPQVWVAIMSISAGRYFLPVLVFDFLKKVTFLNENLKTIFDQYVAEVTNVWDIELQTLRAYYKVQIDLG